MKWEVARADPGHVQLGPGRRADRTSPARTTSASAVTCWSGTTSCRPGSPTASPTARSATTSSAQLLHKHITDVVTHFKGKIWQWDVVNEAVSDPWDSPATIHLKGFWAEHLGPGLHRRRVPLGPRRRPERAAVLQRLQHRGVRRRRTRPTRRSFVYNMVKQLRPQGVPIDGVGSQGHLGTQYGNYDALQVSDALQAVHRSRGGDGLHRGRRPQPDDRRRPGRRLERDQPAAAGVGGQLQRADAGVPVQPALPVVHRLGLHRQALVDPRLVHQPRRRAWRTSTTRTTNPSGRTTHCGPTSHSPDRRWCCRAFPNCQGTNPAA